MVKDGQEYELLKGMLESGKKVAIKDGNLKYYEDFNCKNDSGWSSSLTKWTNVEYIYTNPQFNRMFALLEDGRKVDYELSFMQMFWNTFVEYIPPKPKPKKMTLEEVQEKLGYEIEII